MDADEGADTDLGLGSVDSRSGSTKENMFTTETEVFLNVKGSDGEFSSASSSSHSSTVLLSSSSLSSPLCVEEEKETGCSKSFTGLKFFGRR